MYRNVLLLFILFSYLLAYSAAPAAVKPVITADTTYYDTDTGLYMLKGHVRVEVGSRVITSGQAKVSLSSLE